MALNANSQDSAVVSPQSALAGILALLLDERESRTKDVSDAIRSEVLLSRAGLSVDEIMKLTGKKSDTVRKIISRASKGGSG